MSHNLDITDGKAAFVGSEDAWHHLGHNVGGTFTAETAMEKGLLGGWNVRKLPLYATAEDGTQVPYGDNRVMIVRDNPVHPGQIDPLGIMGGGVGIVQNEEHAELLNLLVHESGAHFTTAGALDGGRKVFITMKLPGHIRVGGVDLVDNYIAAVNSFDGSMSFCFMVTPVRIVCANTLNLAFAGAENILKVPHTSRVKENLVIKAQQTLEMTFEYLDGFQQEAEQLIQTSMTQQRFEEIITAEFGAPEGSGRAAVTRSENKLDKMAELFADADTQAGIRGTAWAGLNAMTEWYDHFSPVRGADHDGSRAQNAILAPDFKNKALSLMMAEV